MYALIDFTKDNQIKFGCTDRAGALVVSAGDFLSAGLLSGLVDFLAEQGYRLTDCRGLAVRLGVGRFTASRVAVTVANALGYSLKIPLAGLPPEATVDLTALFQNASPSPYLIPEYSGSAHIGGQTR